MERNVEKIDREINFLRVGILHFSGLEKLLKKKNQIKKTDAITQRMQKKLLVVKNRTFSK